MTGFARCDGSDDTASWYWEARSVNGKGLDIRLRLPVGADELEAPIREAVSQKLTRGNINISLSMQRRNAPVEIQVNAAALDQVVAASQIIEKRVGGAPISPDAVMAAKGVLEIAEATEDETVRKARAENLLASFRSCLSDLVIARGGEGYKLADTLQAQVDDIARITDEIAASPVRAPEAIVERLKTQVSRLRLADESLDEARLYQEVALLVTRADIEEELTRLRAHVDAARGLLAEKSAVGRRLDFLAQEFNREANTICSKSNDAQVTQLGMALKVVIDQMREQVQNVE